MQTQSNDNDRPVPASASADALLHGAHLTGAGLSVGGTMHSPDAPDWGRFDYRAWRESPAVQLMTWQERGCYFLLLEIQWRLGYVPTSAMSAARLLGVQFPEWEAFETVFHSVKEQFSTVEDDASRMVNDRQAAERTRAIYYFNQKSDAGKGNKGKKKERTLRRTTERKSNEVPIELDKDKETPNTYTDDFEAFWKSYPQRAGGQNKRRAFTKWRAVVKRGVPVEDIMAGLARYRRYLDATGKVGTEYVKQAQTFLGPDEHWTEEWPLPAVEGRGVVTEPKARYMCRGCEEMYVTTRTDTERTGQRCPNCEGGES